MEIRLGDILIKKGLITRDQLRDVLIVQQGGDEKLGLKRGEKLGRVLLAKGHIAPMELVRILCEQKGNIDFLLIGHYLVEPMLVASITEKVAERFNILPLVSVDKDTIIVAANRAISYEGHKEMENVIRKNIEVVVVDDKQLSDNIKLCYSTFKKRGMSGVRIGEILVRDKYLSPEDLEAALRESVKTQRMLGKILIEKGKVNEGDFFHILSLQRKVALVSAHDILPILDKSLVKRMSKAFSLHNLVVPYIEEGNKVYTVTAEPSIDLDEFKKAMHCREVDIKLATYSDIELILRTIYADSEVQVIAEREIKGEELKDVPIEDELAPIQVEDIGTLTKKFQKISSNLLWEAIKMRASDIHIENYEKNVVIRFRIDGTLYDIKHLQINKGNAGGIVNVLKVSSSLDISERRLPQGGRFRKKTKDGGIYDFRVQSQPTLHGENLVLRILNQSTPFLGFDELGFTPDVKVRYEKLIRNPSGLILITGPTGSGKTSTLYSTLSILSKELSKKIVTIEDPVEYSLERIQQSQVKEDIGYNFAQATRAFLREDPNIILIGEIRDYETAIEAMRASQTGHLVFSTLHTNNTIESVQRLIDLEINPSTIASELLLIIAQRLAKKICPDCKKEYRPSNELLGAFYPYGVPSGFIFYNGAGCKNCGFTGHKGRVAIMEFWFIDAESKRLIIEKADFNEILSSSLKRGMVPMIKDALMKVEAGIIPLDEIPNIVPYFQIMNWKDEQARLIPAKQRIVSI
ncbi:MAG: Flp pilus assembly complex ATPase component TadA [Deltaproteobacteria bacterium]|nr:Flp pilus assembly complex ATPase component TadA [Deltaproteobacteria bacterium]